MAALDKGLKQRMVGALVLLALAVIFLPMLFSRPDEQRDVRVEAPAMPQPAAFDTPVVDEPVLSEAQIETLLTPAEPVPDTAEMAAPEPVVAAPSVAGSTPAVTPPEVRAKPASGLDAGLLPVSWSVQLASLSNRTGALELQKKLRSGGYNAYVRVFEGMNRVFVGPVIERAEAERLRDQINRQHKLNGFVVRFQPEKG